MIEKCVKKVIDVSYHRNGIGGIGFYAILFDNPKQGRMFAALFDEDGYCAVSKISMLADNDIAFGSNSWRGDCFEAELRPLVKKWLISNGTFFA